jgi:hypothetical protein
MFVARGKLMLFADADGASQFSEYNKLEIEMKRMSMLKWNKFLNVTTLSLNNVC